jgi:hypothetical protein
METKPYLEKIAFFMEVFNNRKIDVPALEKWEYLMQVFETISNTTFQSYTPFITITPFATTIEIGKGETYKKITAGAHVGSVREATIVCFGLFSDYFINAASGQSGDLKKGL